MSIYKISFQTNERVSDYSRGECQNAKNATGSIFKPIKLIFRNKLNILDWKLICFYYINILGKFYILELNSYQVSLRPHHCRTLYIKKLITEYTWAITREACNVQCLRTKFSQTVVSIGGQQLFKYC